MQEYTKFGREIAGALALESGRNMAAISYVNVKPPHLSWYVRVCDAVISGLIALGSGTRSKARPGLIVN